jgi:NitT/TauT family transport system substrate-binding protein
MLGLLFIAEDRGFDKAQDLEVVIKEYQTGREPLQELRAGRLDLASCAEFALVDEILAGGADLRFLAAISAGEVDLVLARRDKGVLRPEDLRGKTIGVPRKTSAEFFLARFLTLNYIPLEEVTVADVSPVNLGDALASGKVDAVLIWEPVAAAIIRQLGPAVIAWPAQGGQDVYRLLVTRAEVAQKRPAALEKLLRALARAAEYLKEQPEAARAIMARRLQVPVAEMGKLPERYEVFLDQSLLLAMEDETRWMIANRLTGKTRVPDYLDYLEPGPLLQAVPDAVDLVLPGKAPPK